jgi:hypothetical protein
MSVDFLSKENFAVLCQTVAMLGESNGFKRTDAEVKQLTTKLINSFKLDALILNIKYDSISNSNDSEDVTEYTNKQFLEKYYYEIIPLEYGNINTHMTNKDGNITKVRVTSKDADGNSISEISDTQDWTVDDYRSLNVQQEDSLQISSNQMRNMNRIPWTQKHQHKRNVERDIGETLNDTRDLETPIYKCNHDF